MLKGIIMETNKDYLVLMTKDGQFCKGKLPPMDDYQVGQEIFFEIYEEVSFLNKLISFLPKSKVAISFISVLALLVVLLPFTQNLNQSQVLAAYVTVDINPSIQLSLNEEKEVIDILALNSDGDKIVDSLKDWENDLFNNVVYEILDISETEGYLINNDDVLITTTLIKETTDNNKIDLDIQNIATDIKEEKSLNVITMKSTQEDFGKAEKEKMSIGKYLLYEQSQKENINLNKENVKKSSVSDLIKSIPSINKENKDKQHNGNKGNNRNEDKKQGKKNSIIKETTDKDNKDNKKEKVNSTNKNKPINHNNSKNDNKDKRNKSSNKKNSENSNERSTNKIKPNSKKYNEERNSINKNKEHSNEILKNNNSNGNEKSKGNDTDFHPQENKKKRPNNKNSK